MAKAFIFDMDGVLVDSESYNYKLRIGFLRDNGIEITDFNVDKFLGFDSMEEWKIMIPDKKQRDALLPFFDSYKAKHDINYKKILNQNVVEFLSDLKNANKKIALASASSNSKINQMLEQCNLNQYFDEIISGKEFKRNKPYPDIYLGCVEKLSLTPNQCIAIEDSKIGIDAAKSAGIETWAVKFPQYNIDQTNADLIFNGFNSMRYFFANEV